MSSGNGSIASSQYAKAVKNIPRSTPPNAWLPASRLNKSEIIVYQDPVTKKKENKKMGWFRKKFNGWVQQAWNDARNDESYATESVRSRETINGRTSVRFTIYPASGGYVIEHYKQDRYKDSDGPSLTIVQNGDNLGQAVEHILTLEALKA